MKCKAIQDYAEGSDKLLTNTTYVFYASGTMQTATYLKWYNTEYTRNKDSVRGGFGVLSHPGKWLLNPTRGHPGE